MKYVLTPEQRRRERSVEIALLMDLGTFTIFVAIALFTGSVTIIAEVMRGGMMNAIEFFALIMTKRIHRGQTTLLEYGTGKLEQFVNLVIAVGLIAGAIRVGFDVVATLSGGREVGMPVGFAVSAIAAAFNTYQNVLAWDGVRRATRGSGSLIMKGQLQSRVVKLVSSIVVQITLTVAALAVTPAVVAWSDAAGAIFVSLFIVYTAAGMIRSAVPDLIDRSVDEDIHAAINRTLARHFTQYEQLGRVRTRRSGETVQAEIVIGFRGGLPLTEVNARIEAMKASLRAEVKDVDISILPIAV